MERAASSKNSRISGESTWEIMKDLADDDEIDLSCPPSSKKVKQEYADGISYLRKTLIEHKFITPKESTNISERSVLIGKELLKRCLHMYRSMVLTEEVTLDFVKVEEVDIKEEKESVLEDSSEETVSTKEIPVPTKKRKIANDTMRFSDEEAHERIPFSAKIKTVQIAELHPTFTLRTLQMKGTKLLKDISELSTWKSEIEKGGTRYDKLEIIDRCVYDRFIEATQQNPDQQVTSHMLKQWAITVSLPFIDDHFKFKASDSWMTSFKTKHHISPEDVAKYVRQKDEATLEEILEKSSKYQSETIKMIEQFDPNYVISTDFAGCEWKFSSKRETMEKGKKIATGQKANVENSFTAQYGITLSGKLLPKVLICLQEGNGEFDKTVQREIDEYALRYKNVIVSCTKSGKLEEATYQKFLQGIMKPYVEENEFLYVVDSPGGHRFEDMHNLYFHDEDDIPTCTLSIIPPDFSVFCQPVEVYFYRQVKNYIWRLQNAEYLTALKKDITSRQDMIKIHSIIHDQLQAPIYEKMISYAWHAARLNPVDKTFFNNVNAVAFPDDLWRRPCDCDSEAEAFIQCSWCRRFRCFDCFYNGYHPSNCKRKQS